MAANDTLKIAVQIVEDDKKNVESLVKKVQLMLDKDFKLKVSDDGALKKLEDMLSVLKSVETQMGVISKGLSNSSWGKLGEDLNIAIAEFRKLTSSAEEFGKTMSKGFASNLKAELDAILPKLSETSKLMNKVKDESRSGDGSAGIITSVQSLREAEAKLGSVLSLMSKLRDAENAMGEKGFNTSQLQRYLQELSQVSVELQKIAKSSNGMTEGGLTAKEYLKSVGFTSLTESATRELKSLQDAENVMQSMAKLADEIQTKLGSLSASNPMRASLESAKQDLEMWQVLIARNPQDLAKDAENRNQKMKEYHNLLDAAVQKEHEIQKATSDSAKEEERLKKSVNDATKEADNLARKMTEVDGIIARMKELKLDTTGIERARVELESLRNSYSLMASNGGTNGSFGSFAEMKGHSSTVATERDIKDAIDQANKAIKDEERSIKKNEQAKREAAKSAEKLSAEEKKLANAMKQTTQQGFLQTNVLNDLKSMAALYLSIWGAKSFVESMAQITGELELQQKSLEVIIGSASYASQLFGEIRDLSQQSPYTFQDLLKSTRQLAAFGIETKDLYGTMKSLSDIGAGLSVDVQRLILAYGHTKSYGYLSGIQNRQFETAGIDLVGALADRYNKLADAEERAGRAAEHVTRKDVFKMISKKEVGFEDVNAVIMGLDAPGGRFYNMQERQFETLGGKLRNLRNNYNIMMAEMGKANHGMLMGGVNMLNELTENWDKYARIITAILVPLGAFRLATLAVNSAVGLQSDAMAKNVMAMVKNKRATEAAVTAMNSGGFLSAIRGGVAASGSFMPSKSEKDSFAKVLNKGYSNGSITKSQLMMMGLNKDLPKVYRQIALSIAGVDRAQISTIASAKGWQRALLRLRYSLGMGAAAIRSFGAAIASLAVQMAPMAIIGGLVALYSHFKSMADETRESLDQLAKNAKEDAKSIDDTIAKYRERGVTQTGETSYLNGNRIRAVGLSFDIDKIKEMTADDVEELKQELQKFSPFYEGDLVDISKFKTQAEQVMAIMRKLDSYRHAEQVLAANSGNYKEPAGGSFWGGHESFMHNLEEMGKSIGKASGAVSKLSEAEVDNFDKELGGALSRAVQSGAAVNEAEALRQYLVRAMFMSDEDREKLEDSWSDGLKKVYYEAAKRQYFTGKNGRLYGPGFGNSLRYFIGQDVLGHHVFGKNAESHIESYNNSVSRLAETLQNDINKNYGANDIDGALKHAISVYESFAAEAKGISEEAKQAGLQMLLQSVFGEGSRQSEAYNAMLNKQFAGEAYEEITNTNAANIWMSPEEITQKVIAITDKIKESWKAQGKDFTRITQDTIDAIVKTIQNANKIDEAWKKRFAFTEKDGNRTATDFGKLYSRQIKEGKDYYSFWFDDMKKVYDEQTKELKNMFVPLKQKWDIEIDPQITFQTKDLEKLKKIRDKVKELVEASPTDEKTREQLQPVLDKLNAQVILEELMKEEGIDFESDKNKSGRGRGEDREARRLREIAKLYKDAYDWYTKYEEQLQNPKTALSRTQAQFQPLFDLFNKEWKQQLSLEDLDKYRKTLKDLLKEAEELYQQPKHKNSQMVETIKQLRDALNNVGFQELQKDAERFVSSLKNGLDDLSRRWDMFSNIREATGNVAFALRASGFSGQANRADAIRAFITSQASSLKGIGDMDFNHILGLSEEDLNKYVGSLFPSPSKADFESEDEYQVALNAHHDKIKGIIEALKEWQKTQRDVTKSNIVEIGKLLGEGLSYQEQLDKIDTDLKTQIDNNNKTVGQNGIKRSDADRANSIATAKAESQKWKLSVLYLNLMNNALGMTRQEIAEGINKAMEDLNRLWKNNLISASDYASEMEKLHKIERERALDSVVFGEGSFGAFAKGGVNGAVNWFDSRIQNRIAELQEAGVYTTDASGKYNGNDNTLIKLLDSRKTWESVQKGLTGVADVSQLVMGAFDGLQGAAQSLSEMFDALGNQKMADKFSDIADGIGGVSSIFSPVSDIVQNAMSGNIGGIVSSAIQAPIKMFTGPITAFSRLSDKKRDRKIGHIEDQLTEISNTLDLIRSMREKELGYSTGYSIRSMAAMYRQQEQAQRAQIYALLRGGNYMTGRVAGKYSAASAAMADYYERAAGAGETTYAMEYNKLLEQRQKKMEQLNNEAAKKKVDGSKIEQHKKDIAELDAQIQEFASTLLNDLWGIDFKGWASQISDALMTAFENGTSAASAFHDTMEDIMADVVKRMMNLAIIEPFIKQLQNKIIGYTDQNGNYHAGIIDENNPDAFLDNPEEYVGKILKEIAEWSEVYQDKIAPAFLEGITGSEDILNQYGSSLRNRKSGKGSSSNSISQSITEETAGYLTGLLSAMHQDGSVRRLQLQTIVAEQMPNVIEQMTVSGSHIAGIDENTRAIMNMMNEGSGRMYAKIDNISTRLDRFASGLDKITAR